MVESAIYLIIISAHAQNNACLGPRPGWMPSGVVDHGHVAALPAGQGHVLCCDGILGAAPNTSLSGVVRRIVPHPLLSRHVVSPFYLSYVWSNKTHQKF